MPRKCLIPVGSYRAVVADDDNPDPDSVRREPPTRRQRFRNWLEVLADVIGEILPF